LLELPLVARRQRGGVGSGAPSTSHRRQLTSRARSNFVRGHRTLGEKDRSRRVFCTMSPFISPGLLLFFFSLFALSQRTKPKGKTTQQQMRSFLCTILRRTLGPARTQTHGGNSPATPTHSRPNPKLTERVQIRPLWLLLDS